MTDLRDQLADFEAAARPAALSKLVQTAIELAARVRDDDPAANAKWLTRTLPDCDDWFRLAFVLAAAVPDDRTWRQLTDWTRQPLPAQEHTPPPTAPPPRRVQRRTVPLKPCGTMAAVKRHRSNHEPLCDLCQEAERAYETEKRAARRTAA